MKINIATGIMVKNALPQQKITYDAMLRRGEIVITMDVVDTEDDLKMWFQPTGKRKRVGKITSLSIANVKTQPHAKIIYLAELQNGDKITMIQPYGIHSNPQIYFHSPGGKKKSVVKFIDRYSDGCVSMIETENGKFFFSSTKEIINLQFT